MLVVGIIYAIDLMLEKVEMRISQGRHEEKGREKTEVCDFASE